MELDEMKLAWQALDRRLELQNVLSLQLFKDGRLDTARRGLRPLLWGQLLQMAIGVVGVVLAATFWTTHAQVVHLLVLGLLVHAYGLMLVIFSARTLYLIQRIDYAAPVLAIQRQLADLRGWRVRVEAPVNAVAGCFVWIPVMLMNLAWYGMDLWANARVLVYWLIVSGLVGLVVVGLVVWLIQRAGQTRWMENNAAGRSVQKAEGVLDEITRFAQE